jgi:hypothetical protein
MEALLRRNRCSHQRCKYYQRLAMALRAIQKESFLSTIEDNLQSFRDDIQAERQRRSMKKIRRDDDFWVLSGTNQQSATDTPVAVLSKLHDRLCAFAARVNEYFCQSISRLEYASTMLFVEIARGFFLPFCTVAVAAVARVRALLRRLCLNLTNCLLEVADDIKKNLSTLENGKNVNLAPLWTPAQVSTFQEQGLWLQPSLDSDSTSTKASSAYDRREQQCRATWNALGIPTRKRRQVNTGQASLDQEGMGSTGNDEDDQDDNNGRTDSSAEPTPSPLEADVLAAKVEHDMGEAVEETVESSMALDRFDVAASSASIDIDQNLSLVQELQMEKKRKKSKEKDSKRATEKSDKKKKKAKKSKKADFFDDLFT